MTIRIGYRSGVLVDDWLSLRQVRHSEGIARISPARRGWTPLGRSVSMKEGAPEVLADFAGETVVDFGVTRHGGTTVLLRVGPILDAFFCSVEPRRGSSEHDPALALARAGGSG